MKKEWEEAHNNLEDSTQYFRKGVFLNGTHIRDIYWMIQVEQDEAIGITIEWLLKDDLIFWMIHYWTTSIDWMVKLNDRLNDEWAIGWLKHSWIEMLNEEDWL